ncbi:MAG: anti-sigma factor antagonist [Elusimicrobia bacterium]|nr:anti-sigma factor antagonist [Elusimicrobiota bacterium]
MSDTFAVTKEQETVKITLSGRLDATNAAAFQEEIKKIIGQPVKNLVFLAGDLTYISSAGLRVIIFAKQKIGTGASVYLIGAQESVLNVIKMSGLDNFMHIQDTFEG